MVDMGLAARGMIALNRVFILGVRRFDNCHGTADLHSRADLFSGAANCSGERGPRVTWVPTDLYATVCEIVNGSATFTQTYDRSHSEVQN